MLESLRGPRISQRVLLDSPVLTALSWTAFSHRRREFNHSIREDDPKTPANDRQGTGSVDRPGPPASGRFEVANSMPTIFAVTTPKPRSISRSPRTKTCPSTTGQSFITTAFARIGCPRCCPPKDASGPLPCVVFVHGIGNDKEFMRRHGLDVPFVRAGFEP